MIEEIGAKIRNLRIAAELTQEELAQRAELTDGFISQIERGRTSISIDSLKQILDALNVSLSDFFKEEKHERIGFTKEDQVEIDEGGTCNLVLLVPGATNRLLEPALLTLPPESATSVRQPYAGDNYGYVLKGRIEVQFGSDIVRVRVGESFYFTADREHRLSNPGKVTAVILWVMSPPYL